MTTWKFIETAEAEKDGWIIDSGNGMLLRENEDGTITTVALAWETNPSDEWRCAWYVCEYAANLELLSDNFDVDPKTVENLVGGVEMMNLVTTKEIPTPWGVEFF